MAPLFSAKARALCGRLYDDRRGGVSVEYLIVTSVGLFIAAGLGVLGVAMVDAYGASLQILYSEFP